MLAFLENLTGIAAFGNYPVLSSIALFVFVFLPALLILVSIDLRANLPPKFNYLTPLVTGGLKLKETGPLTLIRKGYEQLGDCYRIRVLHRNVIILVGPKAHAAFMAPNDHKVSASDVYRFTVPVFGEGVVYDAPLHKMQEQLKFVSQGLTGPALDTHAPKIRAEVEEFFGALPPTGELDMFETFAELVINTATRCLLGNKFRQRLGKEVAHLYQDLSDGMNHMSVFWPYAPTKKHAARDAARVKMVQMFNDVLAERRKSNVIEQDYLQLLIDSKYKDGKSITDHEIHGLLLGTLFAGQHTSSITSTWLGGLILKNPRLWKPLVEEQERVMSRYNGQITLDALQDMELLGACMKETLRMYPPLVALARKLKEDQTYERKADGKTFLLPKGDIIVVCPPVAHRLPEVYKNPDEFYPERFLGDNPEAQEKFSYIAFGGGRHGCLGERFAFVQVKTIWSIILRNFTFELVKPELPPVNYDDIVAGPRPPLMVRYKRLDKPIGPVAKQIPNDVKVDH